MKNPINVERFAILLAKRWRRNRDFCAQNLSELKNLTWYAEGMYPEAQLKACQAIEARASELFNEQGSYNHE